MSAYNLQQIEEFWSTQAAVHGQSASASWSDHSVIEMEIRELAARLSDGQQVLDIGCANGYSSVALASQRNIRVRGLDYIPEMIAQARERLAAHRDALRGEVAFDVGDILALNEPPASYDAVVCVRVIINLADWERQQQGLRNCVRVLKPGGTFLLSEATVQGWRMLNALRVEWGLPEIGMPPFNCYLDEEAVVKALSPECELVEIVNFASSYYVGTRVLKPLLARGLGQDVDVANPDMHWNRWCASLPAAGDYGTQKLFVFRRRS